MTTNFTSSNFPAHPFHLVSPLAWPLYTFIVIITLQILLLLYYTNILNFQSLFKKPSWVSLLENLIMYTYRSTVLYLFGSDYPRIFLCLIFLFLTNKPLKEKHGNI